MKRLTNSIAWAVIAAPLLLFALSSCRSTLEPDPSGGDDGILSPDVTTLKLSFGDGPSGDDPDSKVTIRSTTGKFLWSKDDRVMVWYAPDPENPSAGGSWSESSTIKAEEQVHVTPNNAGDIRCAVAIYPPAAAVPGSCTTINYPATYNLANKTDEYVPVPMVAKNDANKAGLRFYHAGALLRFNVYAVPAGTKTLEVSFTDRNGDPLQVTGHFNFSMAAGDSFATTGPAGSNGNTVTLTLTDAENGLSTDVDDLVINVPVPVVTIGGFEIRAYGKNHSLTILEGDKITQEQLSNTWAWDALRALGLEKSVCFGYHPPQNPIIGATDASHKFSVGPDKQVYIARSNLAYFGESFPDTPWRLTENPWDGLGLSNGEKSDFDMFYPHTSGYVPAGYENNIYSRYRPWVTQEKMVPWNPKDEMENNPQIRITLSDVGRLSKTSEAGDDYIPTDFEARFGRVQDIHLWDWGLYNGRPDRQSNPHNPNATGLWTYDGQEMDGEWRTINLQEFLYLVGVTPFDNGTFIDNGSMQPVTAGFYELQTHPPFMLLPAIDISDGGYLYLDYAPLGGFLEGQVHNPMLGWYFNFATDTWQAYQYECAKNPYSYYDVNKLQGRIFGVPEAAYSVIKNSKRYNDSGDPMFTFVALLNPETAKLAYFTVLLPDSDVWKDPKKNISEVSTNGEIVLGMNAFADATLNTYTYDQWKFFMEPAGAVLMEPLRIAGMGYYSKALSFLNVMHSMFYSFITDGNVIEEATSAWSYSLWHYGNYFYIKNTPGGISVFAPGIYTGEVYGPETTGTTKIFRSSQLSEASNVRLIRDATTP